MPVSAFHTRLLNLINRPYDQREYHDLFKSATVRKPVIKYKYLKTRDVPYETAKLGSSYFDHYPGTTIIPIVPNAFHLPFLFHFSPPLFNYVCFDMIVVPPNFCYKHY